MNNPAIPLKPASDHKQFRSALILLLCAHIATLCISMSHAIGAFPGIVAFAKSHLLAAALNVATFALAAALFVFGRFSFGYFAGFYLYTMVLGYLWLSEFSLLSYDHNLARISIFLSALAFLVPAVLVTSPIKQRFALSANALDKLSSAILILAVAVVSAGALSNFKLVGLSEIYKYRAGLELPALLRYAIGIVSNALLPFAFAYFVMREHLWRAGLVLLLLLLLYPVTLTKLTLFAPLWLLFLALLSRFAETRAAVILSLLLPMLAGVVVFFLIRIGMVSNELARLYVGVVNVRMIAMPSIAIEVYNNYFSSHALTHFCQINILKLFVSCPYDEPLSVVMSKAYQLGAFNASLFATEGIASVNLMLAPLSALLCGLVIAFANRLSSTLPPQFVLISAAMLPQTLLNVPLSTTLLTHGAALLFLLWYITPRSAFAEPRPETLVTGGHPTDADSA
jgi:hypothetical protein